MANEKEMDKIKSQLEDIANDVKNPKITLEEALDKYNEAIDLSLEATNLIENDSEIADILNPNIDDSKEDEEDS